MGVNQAMFGTGGHVQRPDGLVIESYLYRSGNPDVRMVKNIVDPRRTTGVMNAHVFVHTEGERVDVLKRPFRGRDTEDVTFSRLRINHYYTKSRAEMEEKWARAEADTGNMRDARAPRAAPPQRVTLSARRDDPPVRAAAQSRAGLVSIRACRQPTAPSAPR